MIDLQVLNAQGDSVAGTEVTIDIAGIWKGGTLSERTDEDGHASFETAEDYEDSHDFKILVRGQVFDPYEIGRGSFTVQLE